MKSLKITASALLVASAAAILGGCGDDYSNVTGTVLVYKGDELSPSVADTLDQTLYTGESDAVDPAIKKLAEVYDATHAQRVVVARPAAPAPRPAAPALDPPLASAEDIAAAKARVEELRGSVKTAKNGAIIGIVAESQDLNLEDMKLFGRLGDLESFACLGSNVTDELFAQFKDLKKLKSIRVQNSEITVETLKLFSTFPELESLDIRRDLKLENADLALIPEFPKLTKLAAYYNSFTNSGVNKISKSTTLKSVDLRGCTDVSDSSAKYLARMESLEEVYFRFYITNDGVDKLSAAPNLKFVEFQDCQIDNGCAELFAKFPSLTGLRIFRSKGFTDDGIKGLANLKLERLELRDLSASDAGIEALKDMDSLRSVELSELAVSPEAINALVSSPAWSNMQSLSFFSVPVPDSTVKSIAENMKGLTSIKIQAAGDVTDAAIDELAKMESLTTIDLRDNAGFTAEGFMKLAKLKNLRKLYVKGTKFGDSSDAVQKLWEEFKKINPKCQISIDG